MLQQTFCGNADNTGAKQLIHRLTVDGQTLLLTANPIGKNEEKRSCTVTPKG